jgi:exodeoxyribonuclease V alpha subunit
MSERLLRAAIPGFGSDGPWYPGRPLLLNTNQRELGVANGDTAVIVRTGSGPRAALSGTLPVRLLTPYLLDQVSDLFAMTVHKSQGSQFETVTLVLPPASSPLLTRELFYTAITRAVSKLRIIGPRDSVRRAVQTRARRASGLTTRLTGQLMSTSNRALLKR